MCCSCSNPPPLNPQLGAFLLFSVSLWGAEVNTTVFLYINSCTLITIQLLTTRKNHSLWAPFFSPVSFDPHVPIKILLCCFFWTKKAAFFPPYFFCSFLPSCVLFMFRAQPTLWQVWPTFSLFLPVRVSQISLICPLCSNWNPAVHQLYWGSAPLSLRLEFYCYFGRFAAASLCQTCSDFVWLRFGSSGPACCSLRTMCGQSWSDSIK